MQNGMGNKGDVILLKGRKPDFGYPPFLFVCPVQAVYYDMITEQPSHLISNIQKLSGSSFMLQMLYLTTMDITKNGWTPSELKTDSFPVGDLF